MVRHCYGLAKKRVTKTHRLTFISSSECGSAKNTKTTKIQIEENPAQKERRRFLFCSVPSCWVKNMMKMWIKSSSQVNFFNGGGKKRAIASQSRKYMELMIEFGPTYKHHRMSTIRTSHTGTDHRTGDHASFIDGWTPRHHETSLKFSIVLCSLTHVHHADHHWRSDYMVLKFVWHEML